MARRHLNNDEKYRAIGMLQGGSSQRTVAAALGVSQSVISRLWARYNETNDVKERHRGAVKKKPRLLKTVFCFCSAGDSQISQQFN